MEDELGVLEWITDKETLLLKDKIEKVNSDLLDQFISTETDILVFIYRENNINDADVIDQLEHIDDELEEKEVELIKCSDKGVEKVSYIPKYNDFFRQKIWCLKMNNLFYNKIIIYFLSWEWIEHTLGTKNVILHKLGTIRWSTDNTEAVSIFKFFAFLKKAGLYWPWNAHEASSFQEGVIEPPSTKQLELQSAWVRGEILWPVQS